MDLSDVTPEKFFSKVTFSSDPTPGTKLVIPNGDFVLGTIYLNLTITLQKLNDTLEKLRTSLQ